MKGLVFITLSLVLLSCKREEDKPIAKSLFEFEVPGYIPEPIYKFENNPLSKEAFDLGRLLFYDPILSSDSSVSCAKCHDQVHAFADHSVAFSSGVNNQKGLRNAPPLFNLAWHPGFMWDGGINHIEITPLAPITNHLEMNETIANVIKKLNGIAHYKQKFKTVYKIDSISDQKLFFALAQFIGNIKSFNSKFDKMKQGKAEFNEDENKGYVLFKAYCNSCHTEPMFSSFEYANNGLDSSFKDKGRGLITLNHSDEGRFKIPSLRNVALTYPYMHDGRFRNLNDVLQHYSENLVQSKSVDPSLSKPLKLTDIEIQQLISFLNTLSDYEFTNNKLYSEP
jgi:cytochrome c peroxidase